MIGILNEPFIWIPLVIIIVYKTMIETKQEYSVDKNPKKITVPDLSTEEYEVKVRWKNYLLDLFKKKPKVLSSYVPPLVTKNDLSDLTGTEDLTHINPACPDCGLEWEKLDRTHFRSPAWTWEELCGREGYMVTCPNCKKFVGFDYTVISQ